MVKFTYMSQPPKRYTFEQPKLRQWVEGWCRGKVLNLFAGRVRLCVSEVRVDIDHDMPADYHCDAFEFLTSWTGAKFDTVVFDPPYNLRKSREKYNGRCYGSLRKIKDSLLMVLKPGGHIITLGYDTVGMSFQRGFVKIAICLVCHGGDHNDTIGLVERYDMPNLFPEIGGHSLAKTEPVEAGLHPATSKGVN